MEEHGGNIYKTDIELDFSVNVNPFGMPHSVKEAALDGIELSGCYPDLYKRELTEALTSYYGVIPEQLIIGSGAAELIYAAVSAFRPKSAFIIGPTFSEYERALKAFDCKVSYYLAAPKTGYEVKDEVLEQLERSKCDFVFTCNPNNPTGRLLSEEVLEGMLEVCRRTQKYLIIDECFLELTGNESGSCIHRLDLLPQVMILKAFTKSFAVPGLRLGFLFTGNEAVKKRIERILPPWNVSVPAQLAGTAAAREDGYVKSCMAYLIKEREWMRERLMEIGFYVYPSDTVFLLFEGPRQLQEYCRRHRILIRDGSSFYGIPKGTYRISIKKREDNERLLELFKDAVGEQPWQK